MFEYNGYGIEPDGAFGMKKIKSIGSGALPEVLKGSFTSTSIAMRAVDQYLSTKEVKTNGKEAGTSRG